MKGILWKKILNQHALTPLTIATATVKHVYQRRCALYLTIQALLKLRLQLIKTELLSVSVRQKRLFKTVVPKTTVILIAGIIPAQIKGRYIPNNL